MSETELAESCVWKCCPTVYYRERKREVWRFQLICLFLVWCQVALLGIDIVSAFVDRLTDRFRGYIGTGKWCLLLVPLIHNISKAALAKDLFHCIISRKGNAGGLAMYIWHNLSACLSAVWAPPSPVTTEMGCYDCNRWPPSLIPHSSENMEQTE